MLLAQRWYKSESTIIVMVMVMVIVTVIVIVIVVVVVVVVIIIISTTAGMAVECKRYHSRLAELDAAKKGESFATTVSWIRDRVSFALLRSALLCMRGSRAKRKIHLELSDIDFDIEKGHANELAGGRIESSSGEAVVRFVNAQCHVRDTFFTIRKFSLLN